MSREELTLFSYEILALVGRQGAGPHDLHRMVRNGRMLAWAGESQYYAEPKRLARLGYLNSRKEPGRTRERTVYTLTDKGLAALREWAGSPLEFTPVKSEAMMRVLAADLVGEAPVRQGIESLRAELADLAARIDAAEESAGTLPHRRKYLLLNIRLMRGLLALHEEWIDEVGRQLDC